MHVGPKGALHRSTKPAGTMLVPKLFSRSARKTLSDGICGMSRLGPLPRSKAGWPAVKDGSPASLSR